MLFGLTNAPAVFQGLMNDMLRDIINEFMFVYLDDILIFSKNPEEHTTHVRKVLCCLLENWLFVKAKKCEFSYSCTAFLGYIISTERISIDPEKGPGGRGVQRFLGFSHFYHRFIRNYNTITHAPHVNQSLFYLWSRRRESLRGIEEEIHICSHLGPPWSKAQFIVEVDASNFAVGAILSQCSAGDSKVHPCAFYSHRLSLAATELWHRQ